MNRQETHGVVVLRERRGLRLAGALFGARDAIEQRADARLFVGDAKELADVRDALDAARLEQERLLEVELPDRLAERSAGPEPRRRATERAQDDADPLERVAIVVFDEPAPLEQIPALEIGDEPAVRLGQADERAVGERGERPAQEREERGAVVRPIDPAQEREHVLHLARREEAAAGDDVRDAHARERERRRVEHLVRLREDREIARSQPAVPALERSRDVRGRERRVVETRRVLGLAGRADPEDARARLAPRRRRGQERLDRFRVARLREIVAADERLAAERVHEVDERGVRAVVLAQREEIRRRARRNGDGARRELELRARALARELDARRHEDADVRAAKRVNRLLAVADHEQAARPEIAVDRHRARGARARIALPEEPQEIDLHARGVLELVDDERIVGG